MKRTGALVLLAVGLAILCAWPAWAGENKVVVVTGAGAALVSRSKLL